MRLINAKTLRLEGFSNNDIPPYAILSHTWGKDEVSYLDMQGWFRSWKVGFAKIKYSCAQALKDKWGYVWVDTCCIDRTSSAELSEAINSMFSWYKTAEVCYVYLVDVHDNANPEEDESEFKKSRWFTRGWTLQELLAPEHVNFYSSRWNFVGSKGSLRDLISTITGIDESYLRGRRGLQPHSASIAERMYWASKRHTTKKEDEAYCLLGIFGVNMPMLYGEGQKTFIRFQEEIMKISSDQSLLAWFGDLKAQFVSGALAGAPSDFAHSRDVVPCSIGESDTHFSMTNKGLLIELPLFSEREFPYGTYALLKCRYKNDLFSILALPLHSRHESYGDLEKLRRYNHEHIVRVPSKYWSEGTLKTIYITKDDTWTDTDIFNDRQNGFAIRRLPKPFHIVEVFPPRRWSSSQGYVKTGGRWPSDGHEQILMHLQGEDETGIVLMMAAVQRHYQLQALCGISLMPEGQLLFELSDGDDVDTWNWPSKVQLGEKSVNVQVKQEVVFGQPMFLVDVEIKGPNIEPGSTKILDLIKIPPTVQDLEPY